jgi:Raf kinase inhibitor-like YbhB/YbcL family protein
MNGIRNLSKTCGLVVLLAGLGCSRAEPLPAPDPNRPVMQLRSTAFSDGGSIPSTYTCDGPDRSPPLEWSGVPSQARALALICDDPDAPMSTWSHWVLFDLSPLVKALPEGLPAEETLTIPTTNDSGATSARSTQAHQGKNDFGNFGYGGPCPPGGTHRYHFRLYALDRTLEAGSGATRSTVLKAIEGHIVGEGRLMGKYSRTR